MAEIRKHDGVETGDSKVVDMREGERAGACGGATACQPMLALAGVRKTFGGTEVLHGIDLSVHKGEVVAVLGPSGSGKTTLLRCANLLERADAGTLELAGERLDLASATSRQAAKARRRTGFVFQGYNLFRNRTVLGNVCEGLIVARKMPRAEAEERARACLARVGMEDRCDAYPNALSGGQQQRVAIARAMATDPEIIFFDEPTSALDPELTGEVLGVMRRLAEDGMTMLVVTHEMGFARNVADRVVFMEAGSVVAQAPAREFFEHPDNDRVRAFVAHTMGHSGTRSF